MTYQVLARKYRPQKFAEVVGQDHITQTLMNAVSAGRLHHAYLFVGVRGTGKTTVARILAKALNCERKTGSEPCGECGPCRDITDGKSLDVQEIDGASNTGVDDVRELRERTKYMPASGKYKIYIIDEVHMLSVSAFNALLKTLEEPPAHVIFIFATTEAHKIPATILSRCQRYDFRRISYSLIAATLKRISREEGVAIEEDALSLVAREATGSLRDAESLFDQAIAFSGSRVTADSIKAMLGFLDRKLLFDLMGAIITKDPKRALAVLDEVFATGTDLVRFAMDILELLRHMLVLLECGDERCSIDLANDEAEAIREMAGQMTPPELHQMFSSWFRVAEEVSRSQFPKMLFEVGVIRLCRVSFVRPIEEIIARLDSLVDSAPEITRPAIPPVSPGPVFSPADSPKEQEAERRWQEFMRWIISERPQIASIFQHGQFLGISGSDIRIAFENQLYADMLVEEARKAQAETLIKGFFKKALNLSVEKKGSVSPPPVRGERKKEKVREALSSDIVRQAAEIFNAEVHDVRIDEKK